MRYMGGLQAQILLWTILPLIAILIVVSFGSISLHQSNMRTMVAQRNARLVEVAAAQLDDEMRHRVQILQSVLDLDPALASLEAFRQEGSLLGDFDMGIGLLGTQGTVLRAIDDFAAQAAQPITDTVSAALAQPGRLVLTVLPDEKAPTIMALARQDTPLVAVGISSADALHVPALLTQLKTGPRAVVWIMDSQGRILYAEGSPAALGLKNGSDLALLEDNAPGARFYSTQKGGDEHVIAYASINTAGWMLVIDEPWADVIVPILRYTLLAPLLVLVAAIVSLGAIYFGLRRVIRPLQALGYRSSRLAWGDFEAIRQPVGGIGEIGELQRTLQQMAGQIQRYQAGMQDYIAALTRAQEEERRRLARDLHDDTVQNLVALTQRAKLAQLALQEAEASADREKLREAKRHADELLAVLTQTLQSVRQIIRALRPVFLEELGLVAALEMLAQTTQGDLVVTFDVEGDERRLPPEKELTVYRLAQEGLSNVVRHARASRASMHLEFGSDGVTLTIEDDGQGFVPPDIPSDLAARGHFGLVSMYERTSLLGGHLSIQSAPGQGTKIVAFLPA